MVKDKIQETEDKGENATGTSSDLAEKQIIHEKKKKVKIVLNSANQKRNVEQRTIF